MRGWASRSEGGVNERILLYYNHMTTKRGAVREKREGDGLKRGGGKCGGEGKEAGGEQEGG